MKEKIRVIHLITKLELGGAQLNTLFTFENLNEDQFAVRLVSGPGGILVPNEGKRGNYILCENLGRAVHPFRDLAAMTRLKRLFGEWKPHIVHTHSSKAGILGRIAAHNAGVPVIIHSVHGFSFAPTQPFWQRNLYLYCEKKVAPMTSHFIFVSENDVRLARSLRLITDNFSLIRSGFPLKKFTGPGAGRRETLRRFDIDDHRVVCGVIAPFKPQKGLFRLIDIAGRIVKEKPDVVFLIAGDGSQRPAIEEDIRRRGIETNFRLPGFVTDIENAIDGFDIGVSTALWEGLPQSLVQMRLKKKPIVVSDIPGNREVVQNGRNGYLVDVTDHHRFSRTIIDLVENRSLRERLGAFDKEDFSEWDADRMVRKQESLYETLVERLLPPGKR